MDVHNFVRKAWKRELDLEGCNVTNIVLIP